ncbi:MAG: flagella basal body P-ring formation protein FlgA [Spirochaetes bacterium]|nr:flagella basal body P-ring formation protein FlgA [Spirochaetota bacterium]
MRVFLSVLILLLASTASWAEVSMYLFPQVERGRNPLVLSDLGTIEGDTATAGIGSIVIEDSVFADGYIDRKEIIDLIRAHADGRVNIYGSGVRVHVSEVPDTGTGDERRIVVRKGSAVRFQVVNSIVRVGQMGTALQDGAIGDEIPVKLKGSAVSRGRVVSERVVELVL